MVVCSQTILPWALSTSWNTYTIIMQEGKIL